MTDMTDTCETSSCSQWSTVFAPWSLREQLGKSYGPDLVLRNRIVMAPMTRRFASEDGVPTAEMAAYYRKRAAGEVGLIISEGTAVDSLHAYDTKTVPRFETDEQIDSWKRIVDEVHAEGSAFAPQLWHCGRLSSDPIGPSCVSSEDLPRKADGSARPGIREMDEGDFSQVENAFAEAARKAKLIGCDAVELHGAHGYLLDSFLSNATNLRKDDYGGSLANRMRFPLRVVRAVRSAVGDDYPIIYRFSQWRIDDFNDVKFANPDELGVWVNGLKDAGVDVLHVSTRSAVAAGFPEVDGERTLAGWARKLSGLPVIAVGKISVTLTMDEAFGEREDAVSDPTPAFALLDRGEADLLAVGRALIANPDWVRIVRDEDWRMLKPFDRTQLGKLV